MAGAVALRAREPGFFDQEELRLLSEMVAEHLVRARAHGQAGPLSYLALYDPLTGLPNRTLFHERLTQALEGARRGRQALALALIDLERFKAINDTLGQRRRRPRAAARSRSGCRRRPGDIHRVARLGANLFALVFRTISDAEDVARRIETRLRDAVRRAVRRSTAARCASPPRPASRVFPDDGTDADALFRNAEAALKRAKETGERYLFYAPEINARVAEQVDLENRLRKAVEQRRVRSCTTSPSSTSRRATSSALEALMRWRAAGRRAGVAGEFVPVLEQTGLIFEAGQQVLSAAPAHLPGLEGARPATRRASRSTSRRCSCAARLRRDVRAALGDIGDDGGGVDLEVTESLLMTDVDESIAQAARAARARPAHGAGRLRHRLLLARLPRASCRSTR